MRLRGGGGVVVARTAADVEAPARAVVAEVEATEARALAASRRCCAVRVEPPGQQAALLVADAHVQLLVDEASPGLMRAGAVPVDVVAVAHQPRANGPMLVPREAGVLLATRPRARPDARLTAGEDGAPLVAKAAIQLLVVGADVAVVHRLQGLQRDAERGILLRRRLRLRLCRRPRLLRVRVLCEAELREVRRGEGRGVVVAPSPAHVKALVRPAVPRVQAAEAVDVATSRRAEAVRKDAAREQRALLVADAGVELLIQQAGAGLVGAAAVAADVVARTHDVHRELALLVHGCARVPGATCPRARADRRLVVCEQHALLVAEAAPQLLVEVARIAVPHVLQGLQVRPGSEGVELHDPRRRGNLR
mmetsp:Transcript_64112/g.184250  ORF Transcript_64112/g.184250 Transcript_64112/m.184250 type:complete len:365 (+) Transcript_64112:218-1312(+)